jgi:ATP-binding cassette, subfamily C (CFTR/MRP), member 1
LNIVLHLLVAAVAVGVITLAVTLRGTTSGSQIGLALNMILAANATLVSLIVSWTNLEISLGAVSRLRSLEKDVVQEDDGLDSADRYLATPWPEPGAVQLTNITAAYKYGLFSFSDTHMIYC